MSSQAYADRLARAIEVTGLAEAVNTNFGDGRISVLLRVKQGVEPKWNDVIRNVLLATDFFAKQAHAWHSHICRVYFLKEVGNEKRLVFGWNISITSQDMTHSLDEVVRVLQGGDPEPKPTTGPHEITEFPLVGVRGERNVPGASGKGAHPIGGKSDFRPPVRR